MGYFFNTNYVLPFLSVCCPFCDINFYFAIVKYRQTHRYNAHIYVQILKQFMMCYGIYILFYQIV